MKTQTFTIVGMHCTACALTIDLDLEETAGIAKAKTDYASGKTVVTYDPIRVKPDGILRIIKKSGYEAII